ncbi:MAG TPA: CoA transferase, partial [Halobacteriales archaeon]|nr:CoA transferase [Halobacteriales archaeon]
LFASRPREAWLDLLADVDAAIGPVNSPAEMVEDPQLSARGLVRRPPDAPPRVGFPYRSSAEPEATDESIPGHGEHTAELLGECGYSGEEVEALRDDGVVL